MDRKERYINLSDRQVKDTQNQSQDFLSIKTICRLLNNQDSKIADLEAKLAKSDMEVFMLTKNNECFKNDIKQLKQQLAEKENEIEKLKIILSMQAVQVPEEQRLNLITTNCIQYNPNQTAIAELQKVIQCLYDLQAPISIIDQIDQQIKELKGDK